MDLNSLLKISGKIIDDFRLFIEENKDFLSITTSNKSKKEKSINHHVNVEKLEFIHQIND